MPWTTRHLCWFHGLLLCLPTDGATIPQSLWVWVFHQRLFIADIRMFFENASKLPLSPGLPWCNWQDAVQPISMRLLQDSGKGTIGISPTHASHHCTASVYRYVCTATSCLQDHHNLPEARKRYDVYITYILYKQLKSYSDFPDKHVKSVFSKTYTFEIQIWVTGVKS